MIELDGRYNSAKVFTDEIDDTSFNQIQQLLNLPEYEDAQIRFMPDIHAGAGCVIGTTIVFDDMSDLRIAPQLVGVDIGCGVLVHQLHVDNVDLRELDATIRKYIPAGFDVHEKKNAPNRALVNDLLDRLHMPAVDRERAHLSLGTLGGGNHYIELNKDEDDELYLVIHSGSRNAGKTIADAYISLARQTSSSPIPYLTGEHARQYLNDMEQMVTFAAKNRSYMAQAIFDALDIPATKICDTIHNYVEERENHLIIRKGAVSAYADEVFIIPIHMAFGSFLCLGKGAGDWNYSAPHGAGRVLSRRQAKRTIDMGDYKAAMRGVYSTSINRHTIDESPFAYKDQDHIIRHLDRTAVVMTHLRAIYNFKG